MTEDTTDDFDWGQLGSAWWADVGKQLGASERQLRFAVCKYRGCSNTQAAREAGYRSADPDGIRSTGYRLARSNIIERLLAFAAAEASGEGYDGSVDRSEGRRILSSLARGSDPSIRIRAVEQLAKFDEADRQAQAATQGDITLEEAKEQLIAALGPEITAMIEVATSGTATTPGMETLAFNWIRANPQRAKELAEFWLRPSSGKIPNNSSAETEK
jgi:hypothetical protein